MEQFNLEKWLQDKSRKVVTRDGRPVRILCTDAKAKDGCCIIAVIETDGEEEGYQFFKNGKAYSSKSSIEDCADLFFADEEEQLTEFERELEMMMISFSNGNLGSDVRKEMPKKKLHNYAHRLLDLARNELENDAVEFAKSYMEDVNPSFEKVQESEELWRWKTSCLRGINKAYTQGKQDALKNLPKWKTYKGELIGNGLIFEDNVNLVLVRNGYYIDINELEKLSKEE